MNICSGFHVPCHSMLSSVTRPHSSNLKGLRGVLATCEPDEVRQLMVDDPDEPVNEVIERIHYGLMTMSRVVVLIDEMLHEEPAEVDVDLGVLGLGHERRVATEL